MNPFSEHPHYDGLGLAQSGKVSVGELLDAIIAKAVKQTSFTPLANISGQPVMSVPLYWSDDCSPHGTQFMAAIGTGYYSNWPASSNRPSLGNTGCRQYAVNRI